MQKSAAIRKRRNENAEEFSEEAGQAVLTGPGQTGLVLCSGSAGATIAIEAFARTYGLSERESQACLLAAEGLGEKEIGSTLGLSEKTVSRYLERAGMKCGCRDRKGLRRSIFHFMGTAWTDDAAGR